MWLSLHFYIRELWTLWHERNYFQSSSFLLLSPVSGAGTGDATCLSSCRSVNCLTLRRQWAGECADRSGDVCDWHGEWTGDRHGDLCSAGNCRAVVENDPDEPDDTAGDDCVVAATDGFVVFSTDEVGMKYWRGEDNDDLVTDSFWIPGFVEITCCLTTFISCLVRRNSWPSSVFGVRLLTHFYHDSRSENFGYS